MRPIHPLSDLLNKEFAALARRTNGDEDYGTNVRQAEFLQKKHGFSEMKASRLSRLRRSDGERLTRGKAEKIAAAIRSDLPVSEQQVLVDEMLLVAQTPANSRDSVPSTQPDFSLNNFHRLFQRLCGPNTLVCVEYRDLPRADSLAEHAECAADVGRAIANGLSFAMFQPFGNNILVDARGTRKIELHTEMVRMYLRELQERVRGAYRRIYSMARDAGATEEIIRSRLRLYERRGSQFLGTGIQSRLFYVEIASDNHSETQVWEWIAVAPQDDLFVRRSEESAPAIKIAPQFFPVREYWFKKRCLPVDDAAMRGAYNESKTAAKANFNPNYWSIFEDKAIAHGSKSKK